VIYDDGSSEPVRVFDSGVVYRDPETFGEYHLSYRSGDILSPKIENYEPLGRELRDFIQACRLGTRMEFHTVLARSVVRMIEAAERSLALGGQAIDLDHSDLGERLRDLSLSRLDDAPSAPRAALEPREETELLVDGLSL
jgi:hypothetical protein